MVLCSWRRSIEDHAYAGVVTEGHRPAGYKNSAENQVRKSQQRPVLLERLHVPVQSVWRWWFSFCFVWFLNKHSVSAMHSSLWLFSFSEALPGYSPGHCMRCRPFPIYSTGGKGDKLCARQAAHLPSGNKTSYIWFANKDAVRGG